MRAALALLECVLGRVTENPQAGRVCVLRAIWYHVPRTRMSAYWPHHPVHTMNTREGGSSENHLRSLSRSRNLTETLVHKCLGDTSEAVGVGFFAKERYASNATGFQRVTNLHDGNEPPTG